MPDRQTIADVEEKVAGFALLVRGPGLKAEHLVREDARAELHADLTALLASHRKMRKALEKVRDVHVNKHTDNVWSAATRCREIAASALQGDAHEDR